jgi:hypothetical protein
MKISDDDLILYRMRDGLAPEEAARIERALGEDPALAARYRSLASDLDRLVEVRAAPVPAAALQRWRLALDKAARPAPRPALGLGPRFAVAVMVALIVGVGAAFLAFRDDAGAGPQGPEGPLANARIERGLQLHLLELESQLALTSELPAEERASAVRRLAQQNRLQTAVAERAGGARDARVLRAFTVALDDMATEKNGEFKAALAQLHFEMNVMQERLASSSPSTGVRRMQAL